MTGSPDPYETLGVARSASDEELRMAYRRLVQRHHPDHNNGSAESARRFTEIQEAYARVRVMRAQDLRIQATAAGDPADHRFDDRLAAMERELQAARREREKAMRAAERSARRASARAGEERPSDEELGHISTDDSFTRILDDFADQVSARFSAVDESGPRGRSRARTVADWIDELGSRLTGDGSDRS